MQELKKKKKKKKKKNQHNTSAQTCTPRMVQRLHFKLRLSYAFNLFHTHEKKTFVGSPQFAAFIAKDRSKETVSYKVQKLSMEVLQK